MSKEKKTKSPAISFRYLFFDFIRLTAAIPGLIWTRPKTIYQSKEAKKRYWGGVLVVSNHIGFFDPIFLMFCIRYRRHHFICIKEFYKNWFFSLVFRGFLTIPIDRENFTMDMLRKITDHLKSGEMVTMFPEGHIVANQPKTESFKSGMILMAMQSGKPIIPVYIKKYKHWWNRAVVVVGEALDVKKMYGERPTFQQIQEATQYLQKQEEQLQSICKEKYHEV